VKRKVKNWEEEADPEQSMTVGSYQRTDTRRAKPSLKHRIGFVRKQEKVVAKKGK